MNKGKCKNWDERFYIIMIHTSPGLSHLSPEQEDQCFITNSDLKLQDYQTI